MRTKKSLIFISLILVSVLMLSLVSCGDKKEQKANPEFIAMQKELSLMSVELGLDENSFDANKLSEEDIVILKQIVADYKARKAQNKELSYNNTILLTNRGELDYYKAKKIELYNRALANIDRINNEIENAKLTEFSDIEVTTSRFKRFVSAFGYRYRKENTRNFNLNDYKHVSSVYFNAFERYEEELANQYFPKEEKEEKEKKIKEFKNIKDIIKNTHYAILEVLESDYSLESVNAFFDKFDNEFFCLELMYLSKAFKECKDVRIDYVDIKTYDESSNIKISLVMFYEDDFTFFDWKFGVVRLNFKDFMEPEKELMIAEIEEPLREELKKAEARKEELEKDLDIRIYLGLEQ